MTLSPCWSSWADQILSVLHRNTLLYYSFSISESLNQRFSLFAVQLFWNDPPFNTFAAGAPTEWAEMHKTEWQPGHSSRWRQIIKYSSMNYLHFKVTVLLVSSSPYLSYAQEIDDRSICAYVIFFLLFFNFNLSFSTVKQTKVKKKERQRKKNVKPSTRDGWWIWLNLLCI